MTSLEKFQLTESTFERLMDENKHSLRNFARMWTTNQEDAEDLYQDTVIKIFINMDKMKNEKTFLSWCLRIMKNTLLDTKRTRSRRPTTVSFEELGVCSGLSGELDFEDKSIDIESEVMLDMIKKYNSTQMRGLISSLTPSDSNIISLSIYGTQNPLDMSCNTEYDYPKIQSVLNIGAEVARSKMFRAKKSLAAVSGNADFIF